MKSFPSITLLVYMSCSTMFVHAQPNNIRKYSIENGLVNNDILKIYNDSQGFIWLCTLGGLSRYDGSRFTNYTTGNGLTNDMINDIFETAPREFIVAQNLDGPRLLRNGRLQPLPAADKITLNGFYSTYKSQILATTDLNGVIKWANGRFTPVNTVHKESISSMTVVNDSTWLILQEHTSIRLTDTTLRPLSPDYTLDAICTYTDSRQRTWIGTAHGLRLLEPGMQHGQPLHFIPLPHSFNLPILREAYISYLMEDSQANIWVGSNKGLIKITGDSASAIFTEQDGLPVSIINCIMEDRQHNIWVGTPLGLAKFSLNNDIRTFTLNFGLRHDGTALVLPITQGNFLLFDGKSIHHLNLRSGKIASSLLVDSSGYLVYKLDEEQVLLIHRKKGMIYHAGKEEPEIVDWPDLGFNSIARIDSVHFLASRSNRIFVISGGNLTEKLVLPVQSTVFQLLAGKNGVVWAGTKDSGLAKIKIVNNCDSLQLTVIDTIIQRLPDMRIRALYAASENDLWIASRYKGVVRLTGLSNGKYDMQHYGTRQGLCSDFARTINKDSKENIWVGTMQGVDKLVPDGNSYRVFNFGVINSFYSATHEICFLNNNELLTTGPYIMHARDVKQDTLPPTPVYITNEGKEDTLPYNKAQIYFEFSAPQFINEDFTIYSYRLHGSGDSSWTFPGKSHSVYFANLRSGKYIFEVRALGFNGKWGQSAIHSFIVSTPFWEKAWFILLLVASVAILIYFLYRYRVRQLVRLQKIRTRIATDLHDEIGSTLTNISILSSLSKKHLLQAGKVHDFLQRISEEVDSSSQALDDIVWSVNTNHDTLEETVTRMRRYAAELFDAGNTSYELYLDQAFEERKLSMEQRRDVYLLYKEAVNNISKHAFAKHVHIRVTIEHNQLLLLIKDDGKGFVASNEYSQHGLNGMRDRVRKWKGKISIESEPVRGTIIQIALPLSR